MRRGHGYFFRSAGLGAALLACAAGLRAADFSVSPIRVDLKPGTLSETITVTNHDKSRVRVNAKLMAWSQDAEGKDVYTPSDDLIYFPRALDIDPDARRIVRVGAKTPAGALERTYRLYIEEELRPVGSTPEAPRSAQVRFRFSFGVPVFVSPPNAKAVPEIAEPALAAGELAMVVKNTGNAHFRLSRIKVTDGGSFAQDVAGWYSLAGASRTYRLKLPQDVCRRGNTLTLTYEGETFSERRTLDVDPARCS